MREDGVEPAAISPKSTPDALIAEQALESGGVLVSDEVKLNLEIQAGLAG